MDNMGATTFSQISPNTGNPLNPQPLPPLASEPATTTTIESIVSTPLEPVLTAVEPVGQMNVDGNVQGHFDVNYQAHDVALASVKTNGHQPNSGLTASDHHKMDMDDGDEHPDKSKSCCSMLNKLFLALAIVCFALFLCSIAYIVANFASLNDGRALPKINHSHTMADGFNPSEGLITEPYFNLTHPNDDGIKIVLSRLGASVHDILIPYKDKNGSKQYRSIVVQGGNEDHFGSVRFGFEDPMNSMNMIYQLPATYPFLNYYKEDWLMYADVNKPYRARFIRGLVQVIYEFSSKDLPEFIMTTMVATPSDQELRVDPTNNIYFNLRGNGNLSTHYLNLSSSDPMNNANGQKMEQDQLTQVQRVDTLANVHHYFYKLHGAGIGKNYIATLSESETRTKMHMFSNHAGVVINPFGVGVTSKDANHATTTTPDMRGVRISPRQSPVYEPTTSMYGRTLFHHPSQAIHTTWWQFEYEK